MRESEILQRVELPAEADLETATRLNQDIWRKRNRLYSISAPVEIPGKISEPVFEQVDNKYSKFLGSKKRTRPLVGYSVLPESPHTYESYYVSDFGKFRPLINFEEFAVDWLAEAAWDKDPKKDNVYLGRAIDISKDYKSSLDARLLAGLLYVLNENLIKKEEVTKIFASFILADNLKPLDELVDYLTEGRKKTYLDCLKSTRTEKTQGIGEYEFSGFVLRLAYFIHSTHWQLLHKRSHGTVYRPGIINICSGPLKKTFLAHEYIHDLSYHRNKVAGVPIAGYKLSGGVVFT